MQSDSGPPSSLGGDVQLPICVFPPSLSFYADEPLTHRRVLKVYNPCEMRLKYRVMSTAVSNYDVIGSEGIIQPHGLVDVLITRRDVGGGRLGGAGGVVDKFRIQVYAPGQRQVLGRSVVTAVLLPTRDRSCSSGVDEFESLPHSPAPPGGRMRLDSESGGGGGSGGSRQYAIDARRGGAVEGSSLRGGVGARGGGAGPHWVVVCTGVLCLLVLALPTYEDVESRLPHYLRSGSQWKLVAAYFLGIVTMAIFTSTSR